MEGNMTIKWIVSIMMIVVLCGTTITVMADENSADNLGLDKKQYIHKPPELPAKYGVKIVHPQFSSKLIESTPSRSADVIHFYTGINFVSTPKTLALGNRTAQEVFGDFNGNYILGWDNTNQSWVQILANDDIVPLDGLVVSSNAEQDVQLVFDDNPFTPPPTKELTEYWNLIGFSDIEPATARDTLYCVHDEWSEAMGFDALNQTYETSIINGGSGIHSDEREMYPTKGYWLWMNDPGTLVSL
jgi:hypothetical protein